MEKNKKMSGPLLWWVFFWFLLLGGALAFFGYWEMGLLKKALADYQQQCQISFDGLLLLLQNGSMLSLQVLGGALFLFGLLLWLTLRTVVGKRVSALEAAQKKAPQPKKEKKAAPHRPTPEELRARQMEEERRSVHLLSLLQREGRLVDFLSEDLKEYDDAQIGAAVRNIQENCKKSVKKYLDLQAVMDQDEGGEITVDKGFDAAAIKLTGNVSGEPPFKGILQHRGWRVGKFNLPTLSGTQDPAVIAPAEVEIP